jgi:hypothetical protein
MLGHLSSIITRLTLFGIPLMVLQHIMDTVLQHILDTVLQHIMDQFQSSSLLTSSPVRLATSLYMVWSPAILLITIMILPPNPLGGPFDLSSLVLWWHPHIHFGSPSIVGGTHMSISAPHPSFQTMGFLSSICSRHTQFGVSLIVSQSCLAVLLWT